MREVTKSPRHHVTLLPKNLGFIKIILFCWVYVLLATCYLFAQGDDLVFSLDMNADSILLPKIFKPNIDLSGRGFHREPTWPQNVAAEEVLSKWEEDVGFLGLFRIQFNLWRIYQLDKDEAAKEKLLANYEGLISRINSAGGIVILDIFGTPAGMGEVLDKKSPPRDPKEFKKLIKNFIRRLSCDKRYKIWYEVWNAPDLDDFFLGTKQGYLNMYRIAAESVKELEKEYKINIPIGGPAVSWWFQNLGFNTVVTPERSLIYELIKFCYRYHLPLDFISWHGYSTSPEIEKQNTVYNKTVVKLIRDWLSYFNFNIDTPLIVDEWNYDTSANVLPARSEQAFIAASYIPSRIKNMHEAGVDYQLYFCLEDFKDNKEGVVRNVGIFDFSSELADYSGKPKSIYNVFLMLKSLGGELYRVKFNDDFVGVIPTKGKDFLALLFYNYIDPEIAINSLSKNVASLGGGDRKHLLRIIKANKLDAIMQGKEDLSNLKTSKRVKALLKQHKKLYDKAERFKQEERKIKIEIKKIKENYLYQRYAIDSGCVSDCPFTAQEEKEVNLTGSYEEELILKPYSVALIILTKKPPQPVVEMPIEQEVQSQTSSTPEQSSEQPPGESAEPEQAVQEIKKIPLEQPPEKQADDSQQSSTGS